MMHLCLHCSEWTVDLSPKMSIVCTRIMTGLRGSTSRLRQKLNSSLGTGASYSKNVYLYLKMNKLLQTPQHSYITIYSTIGSIRFYNLSQYHSDVERLSSDIEGSSGYLILSHILRCIHRTSGLCIVKHHALRMWIYI